MNTDKALTLAREADLTRKDLAGKEHVAYEQYITPYLVKFAALLQREMEADGWRQCAKGQGTSQFCGMAEELRKDAERYRWIRENGDKGIFVFDPNNKPHIELAQLEELDTIIDRARSAK